MIGGLQLTALMALVSVVSAHGRINVATGDAGGNTTALGIRGASVPGTGPHRKTEVDTTIFKSRNVASDGLGRTKGGGENTLEAMSKVAEMSGSTHVVTTDGAGPVEAMVDPSGTGQFSQGIKAEVMTQIPGHGGNIAPGPLSNNRLKSRVFARMGLTKRALNVNEDYPLKVAIPAGTTCSGTMGGMSNVCLLKVANSNPDGPFGGVIAFQMAAANSSSAVASPNAASSSGAQSAGQSGETSNPAAQAQAQSQGSQATDTASQQQAGLPGSDAQGQQGDQGQEEAQGQLGQQGQQGQKAKQGQQGGKKQQSQQGAKGQQVQ